MPADTIENTRAAALYNRMLTTPKDLSREGIHILVLRLESVSRFERTGSIQVRANEELGSRLSVGPAGRAFLGLDVCIQTTCQVPSHDEGIVVAHNRGTDRGFFVVKNADPRYLRGSFCERRGRSRRHNTNKRHCCQSSERQDRQSSFHASYLLFSDLQQKHSHPGARTMLILTCIVRLLPPAPLERNHRLPSVVANPGA